MIERPVIVSHQLAVGVGVAKAAESDLRRMATEDCGIKGKGQGMKALVTEIG